jgi:site-specific DNA-methyltransferase (cytosine-N4-specific)
MKSAFSPEFRIWCDDAYDFLGALPAQSVDLIITSPPYWGLRTYDLPHNDDILECWRALDPPSAEVPSYEWYRRNGGQLGLEPFPEWFVAHLVEIFERGAPSLKADGNLWINLGDTYFARWSSIRRQGRQGLADSERLRRRTPSGGYKHDKQLLLMPARFAIAMQEAGWILRNDLIWSKPHVAPRPEKDRLRLAHEHFFHFVKRAPGGRPTYYYDLGQAETGALDVVRTGVSTGGDGHSATFPKELVRPRIASSSRVGGVVVDPFCGTGTALVEACELRRTAWGADISPTSVQTAQTKIGQSRKRPKTVKPVTVSR